MRISKKILAIALSILMAVSMMPFTVFAATTGVATGAELKAAIAAANDGDVIEFTADNTTYPATSGALVIPVDGKDITIDLKGHTQYFRVSGETTVSYPTDLFVLKNGATLTVKDTIGGGAIYATYGANSAAYIFNVLDTSELVIESGKYVMDQANYGGIIVYQNSADASTTINDGEFEVKTGATSRRDRIVSNSRGELEINGGTFTTPRDFDQVISTGSSQSTVVINDGEFNGTMDMSSGTKTFNGGTYLTYDGQPNGAVAAYLPADKVIDANGEIATVDASTVAKINSAQFTSLKDALDSVAAGATATITLLDDCTLPATYEITDNQKITIDLNGNDITTTARAFNIRHGQLTIKGNGNLNANFTNANAAVAVYGAATDSGSNYSTFTLTSPATINAPNGYGAMIGATSGAAYGAKLQLGGTINSKYGVYTNGNIAEPAVKTNAAAINITGTVTASNENAVVYAGGYAKWNIYSNANLTGGSGVYIKSGTMNIYGNAVITATGEKTDYKFNTNGADATGDAVIIDSCGYPGNVPTVTIKAGTITSANGAAVASYAKQDDPLYPTADFPRVDNVVPGTSTAVFSSDVTALAAEGYETTYDATAGGYVVAEDEHTVAIANGVKFDSFEEALASISTVTSTTHSKASDPTYEYKTYVADGEIKLMQDVDGNGLIIGEGSDLTIDFNGFTYDVKANPVGSNGTETIGVQLLKDSDVTFKNGTLTSTADWDVYVVRLIQNYSDLTLDNMNISMNGNFYDQTTMANCNGNVVIKDSTVSAPDFSELNYTVEEAAELLGAQVFTVGTFSTYPAVSVEVTGDSTINGNVKVDNDTDAGTAALTLTSGTLNGDIVVDDANAALEDTTVTKGTAFNQEAPEGYAWTDNGDGTASLTVKNTASLTLDGDIKLNFQLKSADAATYEIIAPDATKQALDADGQTVEGDVENGAATGSVTLAPAQLNETVTVKFYDANGSELANESFTYSGVQYAKGLAASADEKEANLGKAILKYAKAAQDAFAGSYTDTVDLSDVDFTEYTEKALSGATYKGETNANVTGVSFICFNKTGLRFYYGGDSEVVSGGVLGAINGDESNLAVDVYDIESDDFDDVQTVEFADGTYIEYSVNSALYNCRNLTGTNLALATALYNYGYYSAAYFA
jgi:RNase P/RNase MRP subunit p29